MQSISGMPNQLKNNKYYYAEKTLKRWIS